MYNRSYLSENSVIDSKHRTTCDQLLGYMRDTYASMAETILEGWGISYMVSFIDIITKILYLRSTLFRHE